MLRCIATIIAIVCLFFMGCAAPMEDMPESARRPSVILISLDTLRQDHVESYGTGESLTPNLDALAAEAVVFEDSFAQIPFTLPSHLSMFTSLYPDAHGVDDETETLSTQIPTLPELLKKGGYRNLGVAANVWMKAEFGFGRGFDRYFLIPQELTFSDRINATLGILLNQPKNQGVPLFLFLHYFDAHSDFSNTRNNTLPYFAPPEYLLPLGERVDTGEYCTPVGQCASDFLVAANDSPELVDTAKLARIQALYAAGVRYLDRDLGTLFADLKDRGLWDDALVILTADHGEELREHGEFLHSQPYTENLAVPLLIKLPGERFAGERRSGLVETVDLLPTILEITGIDAPAGMQGRSLLPMIEGGEQGDELTLGRHKTIGSRYSLRDDRFTLIHDFQLGTSELFDRIVDAEERNNIAETHPEDVARLVGRLETMVAANANIASRFPPTEAGHEAIITAAEAEQLKAIGYTD